MRRLAAAVSLLACVAGAQQTEAGIEGRLLLDEGRVAFSERRYDDARQRFEMALPLLEAAEDPVRAAWAISWIGGCDLRQGRPDDALERRREALRRMREVYGDEDNLDVSMSLHNVASVLGTLHRHGEAIELQSQALAMNRRLFQGDHPEIARGLNNLAEWLGMAARYDEALARHREALAMWRALEDEAQVARVLSNLALCLDEAGRPVEALPLHEESLAMRERIHPGDHPSKAVSLNNVGICLRALGRTEEALEYYRKSLAMRERLYRPGHSSIAVALNNNASCFRALGRPADALPLYERSLEIYRKGYRGPHPDIANALNNLAVCMRSLGRTDEALPVYEEALQVCRAVHAEAHPDMARSLKNLGLCLVALDRAAEGEPLLRESLEMHRSLFPGDHVRVAMDLEAMGIAAGSLGRDEDALAYTREALEMFRRIHDGDHPDLVRVLTYLGNDLVDAGRWKEAGEPYTEAVAMGRRLRHPDAHVFATNLADLRLRQGRAAEAIPLLAEAVAGIEALQAEARALDEWDRSAYAGHLGSGAVFDAMIRAQIAVKRPDEALRYLERGRARSFIDLLERSRFDPVEEATRRARMRRDEETLRALQAAEDVRRRAEIEMSRLAHELARLAEKGGSRRAVRGKLAELAEARREHQDSLRERARLVRHVVPLARPDSPEMVQRGLGRREGMLVYALGPEGSFVLVVPPSGAAVEAHHLHWPEGEPVTEATVAQAVDAHHDIVVRRGDARLLAERLFAGLVPAAVWTKVAGLERVYVVPHGALHRLPFEVLRPEKGEVWLDAGPPLVYAPSASVLTWCRRRWDEQADQEMRYEMLALGDPDFGDPGAARASDRALRERFGPAAPLPGTRTEVEAIRDALGAERVAVLLGADAQEERLFELAPQARMLHLATHQVVDEKDGGSYSRLLLAAPGEGGEPAPENDGALRLHEVLERWRDRLSACSLLVLSACETQRGPLQRDEGVYAMPLGFMYAGCPSVIGSLWRVDDESTAQLMRRFYEGLGAGKGRLEAFTAARRALRRERENPYFWAPFIFIGDPR